MSFRVSIDIGGTFTDAAAIDEETGEIFVAKSPTTPNDYLEGVVNCIEKSPVEPKQVDFIVHGTTVVTNAVVQRTLPKAALITTKGFRDVLEMMRQNRPTWGLYDIMWDKPRPLIPRYLRFEIEERTDYRGRLLKPIREEDALALILHLKSIGVEAIAVSFLFAHLNPTNELKVNEIIQRELPDVSVSISSDVNPQVREYERASTVVINAMVKPLAGRYFTRLQEGLSRYGVNADLLIMRSNGGLMSASAAAETPISTIESGPAGGTIGSAFMGRTVGNDNLIAIDMGGTTFKVSLVDSGEPRQRAQGEVEWGVPFRVPMLDILEVGSGGGSIAGVDKDGTLRVGPRSAGAEPGPACYGRGGNEPTITDAQLVLGRLNPGYLLNGDMQIDINAARRAIREKVARPLGMDLVQAARGIIEISSATMLGSMRIGSVERGYDPRDFWVIAYGGMGPMVAAMLAKELGSPRVVIPPHPGIFSAFGMLVTDIKLDFMRSYRSGLEHPGVDRINEVYGEMEREATIALERDFTGPSRLVRAADLRYVGQNYDVNCAVPPGCLAKDDMALLGKRFESEHRQLYGHSKSGEPIEIVSLRLSILGLIKKPELPMIDVHNDLGKALSHVRPVFFEEIGWHTECQVYDRSLLGAGCHIEGPAVVEEADSTTVIYPEQSAAVDPFGSLIIDVGGQIE